jgi:SAM-dependent methyltransferase
MITNEHFVPSFGFDLDAYLAAGDVTGTQHVIRYLWAIETLTDRPRVGSLLDLGCGDGYGCFAIAGRYPRLRVVGIDSDEEVIAAGRQTYSLPNLELKVGDAMRWDATIGDNDYDCIISFDSIEHVAHRELYLEGVVEHLTEAGCVMLSTPCGWPVNVVKPDWPGHKIEYSSLSLYDFLARYFRTIRRPEDGSLPQLDVFKQLEETGIPYLLQLNPVLCEDPIRIANPYRSARVKKTVTPSGFTVFAGDWDGNGVDLPGLFDAALGTALLLHLDGGVPRWETIRLQIEGAEWHAMAGDWMGSGRDCLGLYNAQTGRFLLFNRNAADAVWREINPGVPWVGCLPVAGKWNGSAADALGLFNPKSRVWQLNQTAEGSCGVPFVFGPAQGDLVPLAGKWSDAVVESVALYSADSANFYFKHAAESGDADLIVNFGAPGNLPVVGDWDGDGVDTVGICNVLDGCFYLRNINAPGESQATYELPEQIRSNLRRHLIE